MPAIIQEVRRYGASDLSDLAYDILRTAVTVARDEQIQSVAALKERLRQFYRGHDLEIDEAILHWARFRF